MKDILLIGVTGAVAVPAALALLAVGPLALPLGLLGGWLLWAWVQAVRHRGDAAWSKFRLW